MSSNSTKKAQQFALRKNPASTKDSKGKPIKKASGKGGFSCIAFPGRKIFKLSNGVIKTRMRDLTYFLNQLLDTRKCVFSEQVFFNILSCDEFLQFLDSKTQYSDLLETLSELHDQRISSLIRDSQEFMA